MVVARLLLSQGLALLTWTFESQPWVGHSSRTAGSLGIKCLFLRVLVSYIIIQNPGAIVLPLRQSGSVRLAA